LWTAGILTGISTRNDFEQATPRPDLIVNDLPDLVAQLRKADNS
jgi:ribonucleotide monophosphatase NagD (HAD superfamily)